ncbi:immunogenic protein [Apiospora arundinis]|uniref:Immunogenic protein n=1 Tax=Apiospora arundinis TaxID=335852 RepID=A0ABR2HS00_9PEZI
MAEIQKPIEVVPETTPAVVEAAATEPIPAETTAAATTEAAAETKPAEVAAEEPAAATEAAAETPAATEEAKKDEEVKPVEEGTLEHKGAGAGFPKNLMFSKTHFWFGSEAVPSEKLAAYLKSEKATEVGHHVASWATETGKGLLFYGKEADKATPHGIIPLADASEPTTEGQNKFTIVAKGQKHAFKAPNTADRDNWVSQLKLKIAEAKELATTVTESETYKKTLETLKPTPAAKKEETAAVVAETPAVTEGAAATEGATETPAIVEPAAEAGAPKKDETKDQRRSASRKRASIFGNLLGGGKKEEKVVATEETPAVAEGTTEAAAAGETPAVVEPAAEGAAATEAAPVAEEKPVKPTPTKRASLFGNLSFGKKRAEVEPTATTPTAETAPATEAAPVSENAPVIPAVETSEPLSTEVASPTALPTETTEATAATNGEKKEVKSDKRKSSLPFNFGKKDKSASSEDEGEKKSSSPLFSKLRQTVKGKGKATEKPAEKTTEETVAEAPEASTATAAEEKPVEAAEAAAAPAEETTTAEKPLTASAPSAVPAAA